MYFQIALFVSLIIHSNAFLRQMPINLIPVISDLESIITKKAISTSFLKNLNSEFTIDRLFEQITELHYNPSNYLIISLLFTFIYGQYKFSQGSQNCNIDKYRKIEKYERINKITKEIIFVILIIFTKDVQNAI